MGKKKNVKGKKSVSKKKVIKKNEIKKDKRILYLTLVIVFFGLILLLILCFNKKWEINGDIISKGKKHYEIGDYYEYDETNGGEFAYENDIKWKVLGVDEHGHLLIISTSSVADLSLGSTNNFIDSQNAYLNGVDEMNKIASKYGRGDGAVEARSVTNEDIIDCLGLDMNNDLENNIKYTYFWDNDGDLAFKNNFNSEGKVGINHNGVFIYFNNDKNRWESSNSMIGESSEIVTLSNDLTVFNSMVYSEKVSDYVPLYEKDTKKYNMLFIDEKDVINNYWTADRFVSATDSYAAFGFNAVKGDSLNYNYILFSNGTPRLVTAGVRVVVEIK